MNNIIFTENGSRWAAAALCGSYSPVTNIYAVYSNDGSKLSIPDNPDVSYFETLYGTHGCIKSAKVTGFPKESEAVYTAVVSGDDDLSDGLSASSKLVTVALVVGSEVIMVADFDNAVQWVPGSSMTISVPLSVPATAV
jgi:hypothetical protein